MSQLAETIPAEEQRWIDAALRQEVRAITAEGERDAARQQYDRISLAAIVLLAKLKAMRVLGRVEALPEMEALEIALTIPEVSA